jgi:UDP:flavonoid glycosyltransferase YjiC (YdhE family)
VIKNYFGKNTPSTAELIKKTNLALVNSNPVIDFAESLPPNVIEVGGLQIKEPQPLDKEIDEFLSKGKKGSILMSLGSNVRSDRLKDRIEMFIQAFSELSDYNFLWKFETPDALKDKLPPNVMIKKWLKQNDILGHPSVKVFMSHSGLLSTHEATYHGIPVVGIPFFADQHRNLFRSMRAGVAVEIDVRTTSVEKIKSAILEVLNNPKYKENALNRSKLFKDRPHKPLDTAVWWCEYLLRNPDSSHLKLPEFNVGILGSSFWDIQAIILGIILLLFIGIRRLLRRLFGRKKADLIKKKN